MSRWRKIAQVLSATLDDAPALVASQMESLKTATKDRRRLEDELGVLQGRELYDATPSDERGLRRTIKRLPTGALDSLRTMAQSFCSQPRAVFIGVVEDPPRCCWLQARIPEWMRAS